MRIAVVVAVTVLAGATLTSACAPKNYSMAGKDAEQMAKDETQCRAEVRSMAQSERNIEDQRRAVFSGERERYGQQELYTTMDNQGYQNNVDRLTARCMRARGWAAKNSSWWQRIPTTFDTPLGGGK